MAGASAGQVAYGEPALGRGVRGREFIFIAIVIGPRAWSWELPRGLEPLSYKFLWRAGRPRLSVTLECGRRLCIVPDSAPEPLL